MQTNNKTYLSNEQNTCSTEITRPSVEDFMSTQEVATVEPAVNANLGEASYPIAPTSTRPAQQEKVERVSSENSTASDSKTEGISLYPVFNILEILNNNQQGERHRQNSPDYSIEQIGFKTVCSARMGTIFVLAGKEFLGGIPPVIHRAPQTRKISDDTVEPRLAAVIRVGPSD